MLIFLCHILAASLLGSLHCAGMCGAFVVFAVGGAENKAALWRLQAAYHGGRLATYALLGALAGTVGSLVDLAARQAQLQHAAAWLAGGMMVLVGLASLARLWGGLRLPAAKPPAFLTLAIAAGHRLSMGWTPVRRALVIGLLTTLLPCGFLWTFALSAAGTGSPWMGAAVMAAFWIGTVPVLAALGAGAKQALGLMGPRLQAVGALAVVAVGVWLVVSRDAVAMTPWVKEKESKAQVETPGAGRVPTAQEAGDCPHCQKSKEIP